MSSPPVSKWRRPFRLPGWLGARTRWGLMMVNACLIGLPATKVEAQTVEFHLKAEAQAGQWRISWDAQPGRTYVLQRSADLLQWTDAATVVATVTRETLIDSSPGSGPKRFWRIRRLGDSTTGLTVAITALRWSGRDGVPAAELVASATDNVSVAGVDFLEGTALLGAGTPGAPPLWTRVLPLSASAAVRTFLAKARDNQGNQLTSEPASFAIVDADRLEPLDLLTGQSRRGQLVRIDAAGNLAPFVFRPGGTGAGGPGEAFSLTFAQGAKLRTSGTALFLDFTTASGQFGTRSPLQLSQPLSKSGGALSSLPLDAGAVTMASLRQAFGISAESGIGVTLFGHPGRWLDGTLRDGAIVGARFDFSSLGLPLPAGSPLSGDSELVFDTPGEVSIPFSGELTFPGVANGPTLSIPAESPLWLTVRETGWIGLRGPAEMRFADGTRLRADVSLADPRYDLQLTLGRRAWLALAGLPGALPANPADCVPATATAAGLATAARCLLRNHEAYVDLATAIRGQRRGGGEQFERRQRDHAGDAGRTGPNGGSMGRGPQRARHWTDRDPCQCAAVA